MQNMYYGALETQKKKIIVSLGKDKKIGVLVGYKSLRKHE
jgi:hypothetical protein